MDRQRISLTHAHHGIDENSINALVHLALRGSLHPYNLSAPLPAVSRVSGNEDVGMATVPSRALADLSEVLIDRLDQLLDPLLAVYTVIDFVPHTEPVAIGLVHIR